MGTLTHSVYQGGRAAEGKLREKNSRWDNLRSNTFFSIICFHACFRFRPFVLRFAIVGGYEEYSLFPVQNVRAEIRHCGRL